MRKTFWTIPVLTALLAIDAAAQTTTSSPPVQTPPARQAAPSADQRATTVREQLRRVLAQYPSTLQEVLRIDPALMTDADYLATYPALAAFLAEYPEVAHNPGYFVGTSRYQDGSDIMEAFIAFLVFATMVGVVVWLIRTIIDYRRWNRLSRVQTEVHSKLLDRFTASEDLLAYIGTPAGRRFLESAPISLDSGSPALGAPTNRIMWSIQAGLVLTLGGTGIHFAIPRLTDQSAADPLYVVGVIAIALGIGFVLSGVAAMFLSRKLGLIEQWQPGSASDEAPAAPPS